MNIDIDKIAEVIWKAEYRRATGKERSVSWKDGVSEADKERYRYVADGVIERIVNMGKD
jgi:hypothetical protein